MKLLGAALLAIQNGEDSRPGPAIRGANGWQSQGVHLKRELTRLNPSSA